MAGELVTIDTRRHADALATVRSDIGTLLKPCGVEPETFARSALVALERNPKLAHGTMESFVASVVSLATIGLPPDGVTGQSFLLMFRVKGEQVITPCIGYRGFNTLGWRAGFSISGNLIREGDEWDHEAGSQPRIHHKPNLAAGSNRKILAAYAIAHGHGLYPIPSIVMLDEILALQKASLDRSYGKSVWGIPEAFAAMAEKTAKRRLARVIPILQGTPHERPSRLYQLAGALDTEVEELGHAAHLRPDGMLMVAKPEAGEAPVADRPRDRWPIVMGSSGELREFRNEEQWAGQWMKILDTFEKRPDALRAYWTANEQLLAEMGPPGAAIEQQIKTTLGEKADA